MHYERGQLKCAFPHFTQFTAQVPSVSLQPFYPFITVDISETISCQSCFIFIFRSLTFSSASACNSHPVSVMKTNYSERS